MERIRDDEGLEFVHPFDDPAVIAGHGSIGLELLEDLPDLDVVVVGVGGGGLISGVAAALKERAPGSPGLRRRAGALERDVARARARTRSCAIQPESVADGLGAPFAGAWTLAMCRRYLDDIVLLDDPTILAGMRFALERLKQVLEPAGAAALAAVLAGRIPIRDGERVAVVLSGGNVEVGRLGELLDAAGTLPGARGVTDDAGPSEPAEPPTAPTACDRRRSARAGRRAGADAAELDAEPAPPTRPPARRHRRRRSRSTRRLHRRQLRPRSTGDLRRDAPGVVLHRRRRRSGPSVRSRSRAGRSRSSRSTRPARETGCAPDRRRWRAGWRCSARSRSRASLVAARREPDDGRGDPRRPARSVGRSPSARPWLARGRSSGGRSSASLIVAIPVAIAQAARGRGLRGRPRDRRPTSRSSRRRSSAALVGAPLRIRAQRGRPRRRGPVRGDPPVVPRLPGAQAGRGPRRRLRDDRGPARPPRPGGRPRYRLRVFDALGLGTELRAGRAGADDARDRRRRLRARDAHLHGARHLARAAGRDVRRPDPGHVRPRPRPAGRRSRPAVRPTRTCAGSAG